MNSVKLILCSHLMFSIECYRDEVRFGPCGHGGLRWFQLVFLPGSKRIWKPSKIPSNPTTSFLYLSFFTDTLLNTSYCFGAL